MRQFDQGVFLLELKELSRLREQLQTESIPEEEQEIVARFVSMVANSEQLYILFGGNVDTGSLQEAQALAKQIRTAYTWKELPTHAGTNTRQ